MTSSGVRFGAPLVVGLAIGAATSALQKYLDFPWLALVNAASPWLAPAFAVGALWRRPVPAAVAGLATCLFELTGYYLTAAARGFYGEGGVGGIVLFWAACGLIGGPIFGAAGWAWRHGDGRLRGLGPAVLAGAFVAEAAISYGWRLHYTSSAILFAVIGIALFAWLGTRGRQLTPAFRWLAVVLPAGVLAELVVGVVYNQSF